MGDKVRILGKICIIKILKNNKIHFVVVLMNPKTFSLVFF